MRESARFTSSTMDCSHLVKFSIWKQTEKICEVLVPQSYKTPNDTYSIEDYFFDVAPGFHEICDWTNGWTYDEHMKFLTHIGEHLFLECVLRIE